jgi:hypothetical protein
MNTMAPLSAVCRIGTAFLLALGAALVPAQAHTKPAQPNKTEASSSPYERTIDIPYELALKKIREFVINTGWRINSSTKDQDNGLIVTSGEVRFENESSSSESPNYVEVTPSFRIDRLPDGRVSVKITPRANLPAYMYGANLRFEWYDLGLNTDNRADEYKNVDLTEATMDSIFWSKLR